jgi:hypothetical protein
MSDDQLSKEERTEIEIQKGEAQIAKAEARREFLDYCKENGLDPADEESMEEYKEVMAETGDAWWDSLDDDDRDGWTDNMNKDT